MTNYLDETSVSPLEELPVQFLTISTSVPSTLATKPSKDEIRSSLRASTLDGVFATIFSNIMGGVLLSNFLVELKATPIQIGMFASIPMLANLLQPLGAYWADSTTSRRRYSLWIYSISRLLWLPLAIAIIVFSVHPTHPQQMIVATLAVMLATHTLGALGGASWLSWLATLVPRQLRGRYFGFRNSTFSLTSLVALPCLGVMVSRWSGGSIEGYGVMVIVGVLAGLISLGFQSRMSDVNPQARCSQTLEVDQNCAIAGEVFTINPPETASRSILNNFHFLLFLLYFSIWAFGINLSNPFFNLYLLDNLALDLSWVTLYNGLGAGANLLMLFFWGKLADQIGNRAILLLDGILVAVTPVLWLGTDASSLSIWLWFPMLHLLGGGTIAAVDLCINNLQLEIAPTQHHTKYFAITGAIGGVAGAMGALVGGWFAQFADVGGMTGLFVFSSVLRLLALLPLIWLREPQRRSLKQLLQQLIHPSQDTAILP
ncbi:MFS transporter [Cyanobacteria bacterium FACHB-DQ100]|nr:MFS transporter [Cyanobacteria bacterium FACHB-DQ100]